ncbi:MAG: aminotransferase class I/II-fold pyridoxal phosphate-dependent enzyme [Limisphaerales bacterium]
MRTFQAADGPRFKTRAGAVFLMWSNDYLGLARHPRVCAGAADADATWGAGAGAARLVCGTSPIHEVLEQALADFKRTDRALAFSSGYATALGAIPAVVGPGDCVVIDRLSHACLVDAARLSGARLRVFRHNDLDDLDRILRWAGEERERGFRRDERRDSASASGPRVGEGAGGARNPDEGARARGRVLVVTESVFSMDGDRAPLREIVQLKERHGAWLMVDEAHATGIAGPGRRGVIEELGLEGRVEIPMGTLGKALGAAGGFVTGSTALVEYLLNRSRTFVFSTAPPAATAAAAAAAVAVVRSEEGAERVARLQSNLSMLHRSLAEDGWTLPAPVSPILPLAVGDENDAVRLAAALNDEGFLVPAIRYPTVPRGKARLRVTVSADHGPDDLVAFRAALGTALTRTGLRPV